MKKVSGDFSIAVSNRVGRLETAASRAINLQKSAKSVDELPGHSYSFGHFGRGRSDAAVALAVGEVKDQSYYEPEN